MKKVVFTFLLLWFCNKIVAQSVIATNSMVFSNENGQISWTLGELISDTFENDGVIMSQGFQQGEMTITSLFEPAITMEVYPNPATNSVWITQGEFKPGLSVQLIDMSGHQVLPLAPLNGHHKLPVHHLSDGTYLLRVINHDGKVLNTYKIIKK